MWSSRYRREDSNDGFQMSPCIAASSGLLTPPSSYSLDARRNSVASSLSSLGPTTPIYGRGPFSEQNYVDAAGLEQCHDQSLDALSMDYPFKASGPESSSYDNWTPLGHSDGLENQIPMRLPATYAGYQHHLQSQMGQYSTVETPASTVPAPCATSFSSVTYPDYSDFSNEDPGHAGPSEPMQSIWSYQFADMIAAPTMAPNQSLIGGEYVSVDSAEADTDMGSYDNAEVPLAPEPQEVVLKTEEVDTSEDERSFKRSIYVSSTGGKTVKREEQPEMAKEKPRKPKNKSEGRLHGEIAGYQMYVDGNFEIVPGTKRWQRSGKAANRSPHFCGILKDGRPCGKKFQRQEHLIRHEKTHSGCKPFQCRVTPCRRRFDRNDNCWEHYWTHVHRPGKKDGRNKKFSLRRVLSVIDDPKHVEKLHNKWRKEVGYDYDPMRDDRVQEEDEEDEQNEDSDSSQAVKTERRRSPFLAAKQDIRVKSKL
ncbi:hypothetical protein FB567DRAFT_448856 [Paraphoma chrysanthemicola]|uniref:C2H2-type domain-containing protein n=1 Tax=Paraphoma chrysanthemicola TaxID=798071 RepID=A0A8K0QZF0_9PLEO|nr:hypothetical protein FB567DRAFT_448856 [Paraphoma chrysanthemicola]